MPYREDRLREALSRCMPVLPVKPPPQDVFRPYALEEPRGAYGSPTRRISDLEELVLALAALESATACHQVYPESVWRRTKKAVQAPDLGPLPEDYIDTAWDYVLYRLALARRDAGLARHVAIERSRKYRLCHDIAKKYDLYPQMRRYMMRTWKAASMRELCDDALCALETYMIALEQKHIERMG